MVDTILNSSSSHIQPSGDKERGRGPSFDVSLPALFGQGTPFFPLLLFLFHITATREARRSTQSEHMAWLSRPDVPFPPAQATASPAALPYRLFS